MSVKHSVRVRNLLPAHAPALPGPAHGDDPVAAVPGMRDKIRDTARDLLIAHGYRGLRFADVADAVGITRANVHYHFGDKATLIDDVIAEYISVTLAELSAIWLSGDDYIDKILQTIEHHRARYARFSAPGVASGLPWSLISQMRLDAALLTPAANHQLRRFSIEIERCVKASIQAAKDAGDLVPAAPVGDIVVQIVSVIDTAGLITQNAGSFERLEHLYLASLRVVVHGYGSATAKAKLVAPSDGSSQAT